MKLTKIHDNIEPMSFYKLIDWTQSQIQHSRVTPKIHTIFKKITFEIIPHTLAHTRTHNFPSAAIFCENKDIFGENESKGE